MDGKFLPPTETIPWLIARAMSSGRPQGSRPGQKRPDQPLPCVSGLSCLMGAKGYQSHGEMPKASVLSRGPPDLTLTFFFQDNHIETVPLYSSARQVSSLDTSWYGIQTNSFDPRWLRRYFPVNSEHEEACPMREVVIAGYLRTAQSRSRPREPGKRLVPQAAGR